MKKRELETVLRAAGRVAREKEFFMIGSQAAHACCRRPPAEVLLSQECDLYPASRPESAELLEAQLGRNSQFARQHGFYVDVTTPEVAILPEGWETRLLSYRVGPICAHCLEVHDLIVSKLAVGRLKDLEFAGALLQLGVANPSVIQNRIRRVAAASDRMQTWARLRAVLDDVRRKPPNT